MTLLNWIPEIFLLVLLFSTLIIMNFRVLSHRSLSFAIAGASTLGLLYFVFRVDLAYYESPLPFLVCDSVSHFGKILALLTVIVFSLGFHFNRTLNFEAKQNSNLFLIFYAFFTIGLFQSNSLVLFLGCALGIYLSSMNLILIESNRAQSWVALFRQRTLPIALWATLIALLFALGTYLFGSIYLSEWVLAFPKFNGSELSLFVFGFLILFVTTIPLGGLRYSGRAPLGIAVLCYGLFLVLTAFWLRLGVPFFTLSPLMTKGLAQVLISMILGAFTLRYAWSTIRVSEQHDWYSSALPAVTGLSLFFLLLPGDHLLPAFYCISISLLFTFALVSHAFLPEDYRHKALLVFGLTALAGMPPLILGEQFYRLIHDAVASGNTVAGILMTLSWFGLIMGITQKISSVLLVRNPVKARRKIFASEYFFFAIYCACVITLTACRTDFIALINEHPILNLW
jgi:hypothetical protein